MEKQETIQEKVKKMREQRKRKEIKNKETKTKTMQTMVLYLCNMLQMACYRFLSSKDAEYITW